MEGGIGFDGVTAIGFDRDGGSGGFDVEDKIEIETDDGTDGDVLLESGKAGRRGGDCGCLGG